MSISYWLDSSSKKEFQYDVVIVGAGIAGVSTAYWLEKSFPDIKIALIERNKMGFGASGRNAGFVTCGSAEHFDKLNKNFGIEKATEIWRFSEINRELLSDHIIQNDPDSVLFKSTGSCTVAPSETDWQRYQDLAQIMKNQGIDVELIESETMAKDYGVKNFKGGIQYKHDGVVHPIRLLKKIFAHLSRTTLFENE